MMKYIEKATPEQCTKIFKKKNENEMRELEKYVVVIVATPNQPK